MRPARILLMAVVGTQIIATLIAVYGLKLPGYRILDPVKIKTPKDQMKQIAHFTGKNQG
jgi:hypothetical protein